MMIEQQPQLKIQHDPLKTDEEFIALNQKLIDDPHYRQFVPKIVRAAHQYGYVRFGWNLYHYLNAAVRGDPNLPCVKGGFEDVIIWGKQGGGKSNLSMQLMYILYKDWDWVLRRVILRPQEVLELYKETKVMSGRIPIISLDDITTIFPKQLWFVSKEMFITLQQFIATVRMRFANILSSTPLPQNVVSSLKENASFEVIVHPDTSYMVERYAWLTNLKKACSATLWKIYTEYSSFDIYEVPGDVWKEYEERRWSVTEAIVEKMEETLKALEAAMEGRENEDEAEAPPDPELYVHVTSIMTETGWSPTKMMRELRKGYLRHVKYKGTYYVLKSDYEKIAKQVLGVK